MLAVRSSAPGSLMLLGEYAVLQHKPALVMATDKRVTVTLTPRDDQRICIDSAELGRYETNLTALIIEKPMQFSLAAIEEYRLELKTGFDLRIDSEIKSTMGLGSSAAVTVATLAALQAALQKHQTAHELIQLARQVILRVQGRGSGADAAAAVLGGIVHYQTEPFVAEKFSLTHPFTTLYVGYKTPTPIAIDAVSARFKERQGLYAALMNAIGECAAAGVAALSREDWEHLGKLMSTQQALLVALGVSNADLNALITQLMSEPCMLGAKISGSGLGDCVIGLSSEPVAERFPQAVPVTLSLQGVRCEKI